VTEALFLLAIVVVTALAFDFTKRISMTRRMRSRRPSQPCALKSKVRGHPFGHPELFGAFLSIEVALTVTNKVVNIQAANGSPLPGLQDVEILTIVFAGLVGGVLKPWTLSGRCCW
jgi:PiT family inorganic phosphate transporter